MDLDHIQCSKYNCLRPLYVEQLSDLRAENARLRKAMCLASSVSMAYHTEETAHIEMARILDEALEARGGEQ